jgi:hypothetical protein
MSTSSGESMHLSAVITVHKYEPSAYQEPPEGPSLVKIHVEETFSGDIDGDRGSPNHGSTLLSKWVMAQIRSPLTVSTMRPVPWRMPVAARR